MREQTRRERESKLGVKGATKCLLERRKLLEEGGVCCKWGSMHVFFQFISEEGLWEGGIAPTPLVQHIHVPTYLYLPTYAYTDKKWLRHCNGSNRLCIFVGTTAQCHMSAPHCIAPLPSRAYVPMPTCAYTDKSGCATAIVATHCAYLLAQHNSMPHVSSRLYCAPAFGAIQIKTNRLVKYLKIDPIDK